MYHVTLPVVLTGKDEHCKDPVSQVVPVELHVHPRPKVTLVVIAHTLGLEDYGGVGAVAQLAPQQLHSHQCVHITWSAVVVCTRGTPTLNMANMASCMHVSVHILNANFKW